MGQSRVFNCHHCADSPFPQRYPSVIILALSVIIGDKGHFVLYFFQLIDIAMTDQFTAARRNETGLPVRLDKLLVLFRLSALPQSVFLRYLWLPSIARRHC